MAIKLTTNISKIGYISNPADSAILQYFFEYMKDNGTSEKYQNQNLKAMIVLPIFWTQKQLFFDTRIRNTDADPEKKWITRWKYYLWRTRYFLRWLHNHKDREQKGVGPLQQSDWISLSFANIKKEKTRRISPYLESDTWSLDYLIWRVSNPLGK